MESESLKKCLKIVEFIDRHYHCKNHIHYRLFGNEKYKAESLIKKVNLNSIKFAMKTSTNFDHAWMNGLRSFSDKNNKWKA